MENIPRFVSNIAAVAFLTSAGSLPALAESSLASIQSGSITWSIPAAYGEAELFIGGSNGTFSHTYIGGERVEYYGDSEAGGILPDGYYTYSLSVVPQEVMDGKAELAAALAAGDSYEVDRLSNQLQSGDYQYTEDSGSFKIISGLIEAYDAEAEQADALAAYRAEQRAAGHTE